MGGVYRYSVKSGPKKDMERWYVKYRTPDGRQHKKRGFLRKLDAQNYLASVTVDIATGVYIDPNAGKKKVAVIGAEWIAQTKGTLKPSTWASNESAWRVRVRPRWGEWPANSITTQMVKDWVTEMAGTGMSHTTMSRAVGVLKGVLDRAKEGKLIHDNPCISITIPKTRTRAREYLDHDEVDKLVEAVERTDRAGVGRGTLIYVLAYTGIRWGEATGLRVRDVNLERRRLTVQNNIVDVNGTMTPGSTKSHQKRQVPIPDFLVDRIRAQVEKARDGGPDALLWQSPEGGPMRQSKSRTADGRHSGWFQRAVEEIGHPDLHPHDLRHSAAGLAVRAGANVKVLQRMLGHKSAAMTLDVYADLFEDDLDEVATAMSRARQRA